MGSRARAAGLTAGLLAPLGGPMGCIERAAFVCSEDADCDRHPQGRCDSGSCTRPDAGCPSSRRYSEYAAKSVAGRCVPEVDDDGGPAGVCGNGRIDAGEDCDDGNLVQGDGCNNDCVDSGTVQEVTVFDGGGATSDRAFDLTVAPGGRFAVVGFTTEADGERPLVRGYEPDGRVAWSEVLSLAPGSRALTAAHDQSGALYVGGFEPVADGTRGFVRKYTDAGALVWTRTYEGELVGAGRVSGVASHADGIYVAGAMGSDGTPSGNGQWVASLDRDGVVRHETVEAFSDPVTDFARVIPVSRGFVVAAAHDIDAPAATVSRWADDGSRAWRTTVTGTEDGHAKAVTRLLDGSIIGAGFTNNRAWIAQFDPEDGAQGWTVPIASVSRSDITGLRSLPDGDFVGIGWVNDPDEVIYVTRFAPDGERRWDLEWDGNDDDGPNRAFGVDLDVDGDILVAGYSRSADTDDDIVLLRISP